MATNTDSLVNQNSLVPKINDVSCYVITSFACAAQLNKQVQAQLVDLFPVSFTVFPPLLIV